MAAIAQMLPAGFHDAALLLRLARCRSFRCNEHGTGHEPARNRGPLSLAQHRCIDSQLVKATESGGICGYDAGKKIKGRKRHILTDTRGFLIFILVHAADVQDRDGAVDVLKGIRQRFLGCAKSSPTAATQAQNCATRSAAMAIGLSRSSHAPMPPRISKSFLGAGWSSAHLHGLADADALRKTAKPQSPHQPHGR
jgi:hypothetical protein